MLSLEKEPGDLAPVGGASANPDKNVKICSDNEIGEWYFPSRLPSTSRRPGLV